jgi:hypothetical protein
MRTHVSRARRSFFDFVRSTGEGIERSDIHKVSVWWISEGSSGRWPHWVNVTEYSEGCIRFCTGSEGYVPKSAWKSSLPNCGGRSLFEFTFHTLELGPELHQFLFEATALESIPAQLPWFSRTGLLSTNSEWSDQARSHWLKTHPNAFKQKAA